VLACLSGTCITPTPHQTTANAPFSPPTPPGLPGCHRLLRPPRDDRRAGEWAGASGLGGARLAPSRPKRTPPGCRRGRLGLCPPVGRLGSRSSTSDDGRSLTAPAVGADTTCCRRVALTPTPAPRPLARSPSPATPPTPKVAAELREAVKRETRGLTCSVGAAPNQLLAKARLPRAPWPSAFIWCSHAWPACLVHKPPP
jgi:hypothetical protein